MKRKVKFAGCILILAVLLGVLLAVSRMNQTEESEELESETVEVTNDDADTVTAVSFSIGDQEVSFTKNDDQWSYDQDPEFPLNQTKIENIVSKAVALSADQVLEDDSVDLADYGLTDPSNVIQYTAGDKTTKITIGDKNTTTSLWYLYLNDDTAKIYLVNQGFDSMFPDSIMSFAEGESLPTIDSSAVTKVTVKGENSYEIRTAEESATGWSITDSSGFTHDADSEKVATLTSALASMSYGGMKEYNCTDMSQYGLENPAATVTVHYTEEQTADDTDSDTGETENTASSDSTSESEDDTVTVEKDLVLLIGNQNEDGNYYATMEGSAEVHTLSGDTVESILPSDTSGYWDLAVSSITATDIRSLDVTYQGKTDTIVRNTEETEDDDGNTTQTVTYTWNGSEVDKTEASTLYSAVISMQAQSKSRDLEKTGEDEITLTIYTDDASYTVSYSPYDSSFYYTEDLQGVPSLVNKNDVNAMINDYLTVIGEK